MQVLRDTTHCPDSEDGHAVTIGTYDGVHIGHQLVIAETQRVAERLGVKTAVVTFDPHPASVIRPENAPQILTGLEQKLELLDQAGVDTVMVVTFDTDRAGETSEDFVRNVLVDCMGARAVVVGHDFHFGKGRTGNVDLLTEIGETDGFEVHGLQLLPRPDGTVESVSSTAIRRALAGGDVGTAARLLGRYHEVRGPVVQGDQRGRTIGFPTANIAVPRNRAMPADAVYAGGSIRPDDSAWPCAINIGKRPTFYQDAEHSLLEAHLLDFDADLYGEPARVRLVELLRSEQRFDGIDALKAQLAVDIERAREILTSAPQQLTD
ncbi:MAG: bifunctional riboflavin kinase/FAD synthetase [Actinomycetota bacterium]